MGRVISNTKRLLQKRDGPRVSSKTVLKGPDIRNASGCVISPCTPSFICTMKRVTKALNLAEAGRNWHQPSGERWLSRITTGQRARGGDNQEMRPCACPSSLKPES